MTLIHVDGDHRGLPRARGSQSRGPDVTAGPLLPILNPALLVLLPPSSLYFSNNLFLFP